MKDSITKHMSMLDCVCILARAAGYQDLDLEPMDNGRWVLRLGKPSGESKVISGPIKRVLEDACSYLESSVDE